MMSSSQKEKKFTRNYLYSLWKVNTMSLQQIVYGKAELEPEEITERSEFDKLYDKASEMMDRTEYKWYNFRQLVPRWNYDRHCFELEAQSSTGQVLNRFTATQGAISDWARRANTTLTRDVWTVVGYHFPDEEVPVALAVLSDQYAILEYTDIVSALYKIAKRLSDDENIRVNKASLSPYYMNVDLSFSDMILPTQTGRGDAISAGIRVSSSMTGDAAVRILPYVERLVCKNGLIVNDPGKARFIHRWGGMKFDVDQRPLTERNIDWLSRNARRRIGHKFESKLREIAFTSFEKAIKVVKGASVAVGTPTDEQSSVSIFDNIVGTWLGEAGSEITSIDHKKKDFSYLTEDKARAEFRKEVISKLKFYGGTLGYSMYSVIQALTEREILRELPEDVAIAIEDWAARYCLFLSEKYNPDEHRIEVIPAAEIEAIVKELK